MTDDRMGAARRWVDEQEAGVPVPEHVSLLPASFRTFRMEAFVAGVDWASGIHRAEQDDWAIERATGQRQLDDATALMREAADHIRGALGTDDRPDSDSALVVARLEAWLKGEDRFPVSVDLDGCTTREQAENLRNHYHVGGEVDDVAEAMRQTETARLQRHASNVRPVDSANPLADFEVVGGVMSAIDNRRALSLASEGVFRLQTADPRFDPAQPVRVNGFYFTPTEDPCKTNP